MGPLPGIVIRLGSEGLDVERTAGKREHRHRLADPDIVVLQVLLPLEDIVLAVPFGQDEVRLDPWNAPSGVYQKLGNPFGVDAAILVQLIAARFGDRFDPALYGNTVSAAQKIKRLFVPE